MNKDTIIKYKDEFNYWLNGGKLLFKWEEEQSEWKNVNNNHEWRWSSNIYIINDDYVEFRKALVEGKTIQHNIGNFGQWVDLTNNIFTDDFTCYRIKPDEPQFKVGDWVVDTTRSGHTPFQLKDSDFYGISKKNRIFFTKLVYWKPQYGEWCVMKGTSDSTSFTVQKWTSTSNWIPEPFIGNLPNFIKNSHGKH